MARASTRATPVNQSSSNDFAGLAARRYEDNDDACDAIMSETLRFALTPVLDLHRELFGRDDEIILNVYGFFEGGEQGDPVKVNYVP